MSTHQIGPLDQLVDGEAVVKRLDGVDVCIVRFGDDVHAVGDQCTHADVSLADGELDVDECTIECPRHGSEFDLTTGEPRSLPAIKPTPVFVTRVTDAGVEVDLP